MSNAARTIVAFAIYMALVGAVLVAAPNVLLGVLGLPATSEPWIRILGLMTVIMSYYYWRAAASEATAFFQATVAGRTAMAAFLVLLGVTGARVLVLFGMAELAGAVATALALRAQSSAALSTSGIRAVE